MPRPLRVFLCHASQDKPAVWKLHRYLKLRGVQPWLDELDLLPGENWEVEIPNAIFSSDVILVCLSKNSVDKEGYVQKEISFALDKALEKPEGTIFVVPVKLEDCDVPKRLNRFQWVDLFRPDGYKRLMLGLQKRASGLGSDVSPVILDDTRRTPAPKTPKPEIKKSEELIPFSPREKGRDEGKPREEPKQEISAFLLKEKEPEVKFTQQKPYTKLLDPSSLSPKQDGEQDNTLAGEVVANRTSKSKPKFRTVFITVFAIFLLFGTCYGLGMNYLTQNINLVTVTPSPSLTIAMIKPPTFTSVPFTPTFEPTDSPIPTPVLGIGRTEISPKDGMTLLYVPAGEFTMGSYVSSDEQPVHKVNLDTYWIDQTEVTNAMFAKCVAESQCGRTKDISHYDDAQYANHPAVYVSWNDATSYCSWAGRRLPTEAEWEKAARGTDRRMYPWGNQFPDNNLLNNNGRVGDTTEVGKYPSGISFYGAYDMAGNVWEWMSSLYMPYPYNADDGRENLNSSDSRVLRGGSWYSSDSDARSAFRITYPPSYTNYLVGFRCARSP